MSRRPQYIKFFGQVLNHNGVPVDTELWLLFGEDKTVRWSEVGPEPKHGRSGAYGAAPRKPALPREVQAEVKARLAEKSQVRTDIDKVPGQRPAER